MAPARFELEMQPGTERTVVVNVDYKSTGDVAKPVRLVASLNDWTMSREGQVDFFPAGTRQGSASPWIIYTPGEAPVMPNTIHQIRVTVVVPENATPGDHLAALVVEQRPENLRPAANARQMVVRYRMASVFYIKVGGTTRKGDLRDLFAESTPDGVVIKPVIANEGNSVIRPTSIVTILGENGAAVYQTAESETLPVLAGQESLQALRIDKQLSAGKYTVKYRVDFQDGRAPVEGVTDLVVPTAVQIATKGQPVKRP